MYRLKQQYKKFPKLPLPGDIVITRVCLLAGVFGPLIMLIVISRKLQVRFS